MKSGTKHDEEDMKDYPFLHLKNRLPGLPLHSDVLIFPHLIM